jgi:hypothetical protein
MGFLDNLESSLNSLERQQERGDNSAHERRESERAAALAAAPWADQLKQSPYTKALMDQAAAAGHKIRAKVYMAWLGNTLRLEARGSKLELRPTAEGIRAVVLDGATEMSSKLIDLSGDPAQLLQEWLSA